MTLNGHLPARPPVSKATVQAAQCRCCPALFKVDTDKQLFAPEHLVSEGLICAGSGRVLRLISAGQFGGPLWLDLAAHQKGTR